MGYFLHAKDNGQYSCQRHRCTQEVKSLSLRVAEFREEYGCQYEEQHHYRHTDQEHRTLRVLFEHHSAQQWTDGTACGVACGPDTDRKCALSRVVKHITDKGEC